MVEQEAVNFKVAGSSPAPGAIRLVLLAHGRRPFKIERDECPERSRRTIIINMFSLYILCNPARLQSQNVVDNVDTYVYTFHRGKNHENYY